MNDNRKDRDISDREDQIEDMTRGSAAKDDASRKGQGDERNREPEGGADDKATGISNRGLGREIDEQRRVPDRGTSKSEE